MLLQRLAGAGLLLFVQAAALSPCCCHERCSSARCKRLCLAP